MVEDYSVGVPELDERVALRLAAVLSRERAAGATHLIAALHQSVRRPCARHLQSRFACTRVRKKLSRLCVDDVVLASVGAHLTCRLCLQMAFQMPVKGASRLIPVPLLRSIAQPILKIIMVRPPLLPCAAHLVYTS